MKIKMKLERALSFKKQKRVAFTFFSAAGLVGLMAVYQNCSMTPAGNGLTLGAASTGGATSNPLSLSVNPSTVNTALNIQISFSAIATGGTSPYTFKWILNQAVTSCSSTLGTCALNFSNVGTSYLNVSATDSAGHTTSYNVPVMVSTTVVSPSISLTSDTTSIAAGGTVNLNAAITGGQSPFVYNWGITGSSSPPCSTSSSACAAVFATGGTFSAGVTVTDANNLSVTAPAISITVANTVIVPVPPPVSLSGYNCPLISSIICDDATVCWSTCLGQVTKNSTCTWHGFNAVAYTAACALVPAVSAPYSCPDQASSGCDSMSACQTSCVGDLSVSPVCYTHMSSGVRQPVACSALGGTSAPVYLCPASQSIGCTSASSCPSTCQGQVSTTSTCHYAGLGGIATTVQCTLMGTYSF